MTEIAAANRTIPSNAKLYLTDKVTTLLNHLAVSNKDEWTAIGRVERISDIEFRITDFILPKQTNSKGLTTVEPGGHGNSLLEADTNGWDASEMYAWIHSHNTMGVFWSGTDYEQMRAMGKNYTDRMDANVEGWHLDFGVCLVVNAHGEKKASFNVYKPIETYYDMQVIEEKEDIFSTFLAHYNLVDAWNQFSQENNSRKLAMQNEYQAKLKSVETIKNYAIYNPLTTKKKQQSMGFGANVNTGYQQFEWEDWSDEKPDNKKKINVRNAITAMVETGSSVFAGWEDDAVAEFKEYAAEILADEDDPVDLHTEMVILADEFVTLKHFSDVV